MSKYLIAFLLLAGASFAWLGGWNYMTPVNISSASALTDYQVQLNPNIYNNTGLVGSWHFSEGAGTRAADSSGSNNDGTLINGPVFAAGKFGNGLAFDGANDIVKLNSHLTVPAVGTIQAWIKTPGGNGILFNDQHSSAGQYSYLSLSTDKLKCNLYTGTHQSVTGAISVGDNSWHQVACVWNNTKISVYVDGVFDSSAAWSGTVAQGSWTHLGNREEGSVPFNGTIDEVRIYNRSLSSQEISDLYNATKARPDYADLRFTQPYSVYEAPVTISGTGSNLTDYQAFINITNQTILSHMRADGADLRFFPSATSTPYSSSGLAYWIEAINSTQAKVWVKANISSSGTTLYMYYGNSSASAQSNGSATFVFFDDFNRPNGPVGNGWAEYHQSGGNAVYSISSNRFHAVDTAGYNEYIYKPAPVSGDFALELDVVSFSSASANEVILGFVGTSSGIGFDNYDNGGNTRIDGVSQNKGSLTTGRWKIVRLGDNWNLYNGLGQDRGSVTKAIGSVSELHLGSYGTNLIFDIDAIRIRKYSTIEPSASIGSETVIASGNEALLSHWLESDKSAWVKVPSITAGASSINMYHGSPSAVYNNSQGGNQTFLAFADFDSDEGFTVVDNGVPEAYGDAAGRIQTNNRRVDFVNMPMDSSVNYVYKDYGGSYFGDIVLEYNGMVTAHGLASLVTSGFSNQASILPATNGVYAFASDYVNDMGIYSWVSGVLSYTSPYIQTQENVNFYTKLDVKGSAGNSTISVYKDPQHTSLFTGAWSNPDSKPAYSAGFRYFYPLSSYNGGVSGRSISGWLDNFRVRKYSPTEPSTSQGAEQQADTTAPSVQIQSPTSTTYGSASVPVNFTATDNAGASCTVLLNGASNSSICSNYTLTLQNGAYTLNVTASDPSGNTNSSQVQFTVSASQPPQSVSNTTTTGADGIGNVSLNGIPPGASLIVYSTGSNAYQKSFSASTGVSTVRISARATLQGTPAPGKTLTFQAS